MRIGFDSYIKLRTMYCYWLTKAEKFFKANFFYFGNIRYYVIDNKILPDEFNQIVHDHQSR